MTKETLLALSVSVPLYVGIVSYGSGYRGLLQMGFSSPVCGDCKVIVFVRGASISGVSVPLYVGIVRVQLGQAAIDIPVSVPLYVGIVRAMTAQKTAYLKVSVPLYVGIVRAPQKSPSAMQVYQV